MRRPLRKTALGSILFAGALLALSVTVEAQQPKKVPRIGFLSAPSSSSDRERVEAFRQGLRELGYVEGQNVFVEYRYAGGKADESPKLAAELSVSR
jgi:putative ABC transport system substrate-binding protein